MPSPSNPGSISARPTHKTNGAMSAVSAMRATCGRRTSPRALESLDTDMRNRVQNHGVDGLSAAASRSAGRSSVPATWRTASSSCCS